MRWREKRIREEVWVPAFNGQINYNGPSLSKGRPRAGRRARGQKYTEGGFPEGGVAMGVRCS